MTEISLCTPVNFERPASCCEEAQSLLSNLFYLGGAQAFVVRADEVRLEEGELSWCTVASKIALYILLLPITIILYVVNLVLRSQHHFTVIVPPSSQTVSIAPPSSQTVPIDLPSSQTAPIAPPSNQQLAQEPSSLTTQAAPIRTVQMAEQVSSEVIRPLPTTITMTSPSLFAPFAMNDPFQQFFVSYRTPDALISILADMMQTEEYINENRLREVLSGPIQCERFVQYLFETNAIFSLQFGPLESLLKIIKEKQLSINLLHRHSKSGETLLGRCLEREKTLTALLSIDPTAIQRIEEIDTIFVQALVKKVSKNTLSVFLAAMEQQKVTFTSPQTLVLKKIVFEPNNVRLEDLQVLSRQDQELAYHLANIYSKINVVRTMRALGFTRSENLLTRDAPSIFSGNMDVLDMHECLYKFLKDLHAQKLLLTQAEFDQLPKDNYMSKGKEISRIMGRNYVERKARELGLQHIKVPKKLVVIDGTSDLRFRSDSYLDLIADNSVTIYAEKIRSANREMTAEEESELQRLVEATKYGDGHASNFIVAEDGVYIIDTEFENFDITKFYFERGRLQLLQKPGANIPGPYFIFTANELLLSDSEIEHKSR